nr:immunoglobulin heavy chain junction region [Macaca mulatta]
CARYTDYPAGTGYYFDYW